MKAICVIIALFLSGILIACRSKDVQRESSSPEQYKSLSAQKYGEGAEWALNATKTAVLCIKRSKPTAQLPQHQVAFFIYDIAGNKIVYEDNLPNGSVGWKDDQTVIVEIVPGIERKDEASPPARRGYIVDIRTGATRDIESAVVR